jgi:SAM-dependent methyltransferase
MDATSTPGRYVHGYSPDETRRLGDQADTLAELLHDGTSYPAGSRVLEVGCGVGGQTLHLVASSPAAEIIAIDISAESLRRARARVSAHAPAAAVQWRRADLLDLPFAAATFDHLFVCFVLEHLADPVAALAGLRRVLRPGGTITVIEGDHGSAFFHPDSPYARAVIDCQIRLQSAVGGDALLGRRVQPLLTTAGYRDVTARPRTIYVDQTRPGLVDGFTRLTFIAMMQSVREDALAADLLSPADWDRGIADLHRTAAEGGTFHYTFVKAVAVNPARSSVRPGAEPERQPQAAAADEDAQRPGGEPAHDRRAGPAADQEARGQRRHRHPPDRPEDSEPEAGDRVGQARCNVLHRVRPGQ